MKNGSIEVLSPKELALASISAERIPLGEPGDYKPCIVKLLSGKLLVVGFHSQELPGNKLREPMILFSSMDAGKSWDTQTLDLLGREPYFSITSDGTVFITSLMLAEDVRNPVGYIHGYLHRSEDMGQTWQTIRLDADEVPAAPPKPEWIFPSRNVLETTDGTLILGVDVRDTGQFLWRSRDRGKTWDGSLKCSFEAEGVAEATGSRAWWPSGIAEAILWQARNGDLLGIFRVESDRFPPIPGTKIVEAKSDQYERLVVFRSQDGGRCWTLEKELGSYYGQMFPAVLRLKDGRLLLTFTVRAVQPPLGVHAVLGTETEDGFEFDFKHDRMVLDAKTSVDIDSGGGFGPTVQLDDGTLITAYSWRDHERETHLEVLRWRLPSLR